MMIMQHVLGPTFSKWETWDSPLPIEPIELITMKLKLGPAQDMPESCFNIKVQEKIVKF